MKITINDDNKFEKLKIMFRVLKQFTTSTLIRCDKEKLYIQSMDAAKTSIAEYTLYKDWFDDYEIDGEETFGVMTHIICAVFNCYIDNGKMTMKLNDDTLNVSYHTKEEDALIKDKIFDIPLIDLDENIINIPEQEYQIDLGMSTSMFNDMISEISTFNSDLQLSINENEIYFKTYDSYDIGDTINCNLSIYLDIEKIEEFSIEENTNIKVAYSTKNILMMSNFSKIFDTIKLGISEDTPLNICFEDENNYIIHFYFAPKISE